MSSAIAATKPRGRPKAELDILHVLWERGASTVREVHEALYGDDGAGYTTALKLMQIMHAKGLVERDDSQRAHVYRAAVSKQRTQKRYLADMVERLFNGSPSQLVLHALGRSSERFARGTQGNPRAAEEDRFGGVTDDGHLAASSACRGSMSSAGRCCIFSGRAPCSVWSTWCCGRFAPASRRATVSAWARCWRWLLCPLVTILVFVARPRRRANRPPRFHCRR